MRVRAQTYSVTFLHETTCAVRFLFLGGRWVNNHTGDAHEHVCARTHRLHAHSTQHIYSTYIWSTRRWGAGITPSQVCSHARSATSLMVMAGRDGMRSSTQQRTEQRWESLPFPGPCATPESAPCCSWIIVLSSAPLGWWRPTYLF